MRRKKYTTKEICVVIVAIVIAIGCLVAEYFFKTYTLYKWLHRNDLPYSIEEYVQMAKERIAQLEPEFYEALYAAIEAGKGLTNVFERGESPVSSLYIDIVSDENGQAYCIFNTGYNKPNSTLISADLSHALGKGFNVLNVHDISLWLNANNLMCYINRSHPNVLILEFYINESDCLLSGKTIYNLGGGWFFCYYKMGGL